jgi:hypothetical protein
MAKIVGVHGVGWQLAGEDLLLQDWIPALRSGLRRGGVPETELLTQGDVAAGFYGHLFRSRGRMSLGEPDLDADDIEPGEETDLLTAWWKEAARVDPDVRGVEDDTMLATRRVVQRALDALSHSRFFAGLVEHALIRDLKQVCRYFSDRTIRANAIQMVANAVREDTRLIIGHSLGSVVAYEALCAHPGWQVSAFVSMGSPLGIKNLIFEKLEPRPENDVGRWPGSVRKWVNVADKGDVVALVKRLNGRFGSEVKDIAVDNQARAHDAVPYLTAPETGEALAALLADG